MESSDPVIALTDDQCWERLRGLDVGRLITRVGEVVDVFPVNYVLDGKRVLFRTAPGSKLAELTVNEEVLFEVDAFTEAHAWSVIVRGHAHALETTGEVERADGLGLRPWVPTLKRTYVQIEPSTISGRHFYRAPEPDRYGVQQY